MTDAGLTILDHLSDETRAKLAAAQAQWFTDTADLHNLEDLREH